MVCFRTVAIDLKGYGGSDKPKGLEPYAISNLVEDIAGVITALGKYYLAAVLSPLLLILR